MFAVQTYAALRRFIFVEGKSRREAARVFGLGRETIAKMRRYSAPLGTYGQKKRPFTDRRPCADRPKDGYRLQLWSKPVRYNPRIEPGHKPAHKGLAEANGEDQEQAVGSANRLPSTVDTNSRRWVSCFTLGGKIHEMGTRGISHGLRGRCAPGEGQRRGASHGRARPDYRSRRRHKSPGRQADVRRGRGCIHRSQGGRMAQPKTSRPMAHDA